jgi:long-chain fatty acid transport protein
MQLGVSYKASDNLTLNADLDYTWWSTYDRIVVQSNTVAALNAFLGNPPSDTSIDEKQWKDAWTIKIGGQYKLSDQWKLRAGYYYDKNPVPNDHFETRVPDSDRQAVSIGAGYTVNKVTIDAAYQYIWFKDRTISGSGTLDGTYKSVVDAFALMVSYKF